MAKIVHKNVFISISVLLSLSGCAAINHYFNAEQTAAPVDSLALNQTYYVVQSGDSLYFVSQHFNVTERTLILWNSLKPPYQLHAGEKIRVGPLPGEKVWRVEQKEEAYTYGGVQQNVKQTAVKEEAISGASASASNSDIPVIDAAAAPKLYHTGDAKSLVSQSGEKVDQNQLAPQYASKSHDDLQGSTHPKARVTTPKAHNGFYVVQSGDNLSSIAYQQGASLSDVEQWNSIHDPSLIYVGQKLRLTPPAHDLKQAQKGTSDSGKSKLTQTGKTESSKTHDKTQPVKKELTDKPLVQKQVIRQESSKATPSNKQGLPQGKQVGGISWVWPLHIQGVYATKNIDKERLIEAPSNTPVYAAAKGKIIYAGVGMGGYGKMAIISHQDGYISAYNNLNSLDVKESQEVAAGNLVGKVGKYSGVSALGFEVRQNGQVQKLSSFYRF